MTTPKLIAIAGYGLEGQSAFKFLSRKFPRAQFVLYDENPKVDNLPNDDRVTWQLGSAVNWSKIEADLIVRSPGISFHQFSNHQKLSSVTNLFFEEFKGKIVGVTGSKGKGTTTSLIAAMLEQAGLDVVLLGNIGKPALEALENATNQTIVVYEMSSFQLWDLKQTPDVAVLLHIEPDHLDVHPDLEDYLTAKFRIVTAPSRRQLDQLIYNQNNSYIQARLPQISDVWKKQPYPSPTTANYDDKHIYYGEQKICSIANINLLGKHNLDNICAALDACWIFSQDGEAFARALRNFHGLEHRLQPASKVGQVEFIDDSIATTIGSVLAAIRAIAGNKVLILGGVSKGADFRELRQALTENQVKHVIAIGQTSQQITDQLEGLTATKVHNLGLDTSMAEIVALAYDLIKPAGTVILSPACSSFDMFKSYQDRGQQFQSAVQKLTEASR